jgi:hypothetical protein
MKGEVNNHTLWIVIMIIIVVLGLLLFFLGGEKFIKVILEKFVLD